MSVARRRASWLTAATMVAAAVALTVVFVPVPYVELSPGPTFDVLGEFDGAEGLVRQSLPDRGNRERGNRHTSVQSPAEL